MSIVNDDDDVGGEASPEALSKASSGGNGDGGGSVSLSSLGIGWVTQLEVLVRRPSAWIVGTLVAGITVDQAQARMAGGESAVELIIEEYLFEQVLGPIGLAFWNSGLAIVDSTLVLFLGDDRSVDIAPGSSVGLLDTPFLVSRPLGESLSFAGASAVGIIQGLNESIAAVVIAPLGIAAPPVVAGLWVLEFSLIAYVLWIGIQILDIFTGGTIDSVLDVGRAAARPFVNAFRRLT